MKISLGLLCVLLILGLALPGAAPQPAAAAAPYRPCDPATETTFNGSYTVSAQHCYYGSSAFLITDTRSDNAYKIYSNKESFETRTLTVYRPSLAGRTLQNRPVVFFIHGGGWVDGYADWYGAVAKSFSGERGWVTVVIDYRLTSDAVFLADADCPTRASCTQNPAKKAAWYPDNSADVAAAFSWTVENSAAFGGDPTRIAVFGHSAGAHLAAHLATHPDSAALRPDIGALVLMSGAYALTYQPTQAFFASEIAQTFPAQAGVLPNASPQMHLAEGMGLPPTLLLYAQVDLLTLYEQTFNFKTALDAAHLPAALTRLDGYTHESEMEAIAEINSPPAQAVVRFIEAQFYPYPSYLPVLLR